MSWREQHRGGEWGLWGPGCGLDKEHWPQSPILAPWPVPECADPWSRRPPLGAKGPLVT